MWSGCVCALLVVFLFIYLFVFVLLHFFKRTVASVPSTLHPDVIVPSFNPHKILNPTEVQYKAMLQVTMLCVGGVLSLPPQVSWL